MPDARLGEVPVAFVEPRAGGQRPDPAELTRFLRTALAAYQVPVAIHVMDELPRTPSLKINLAALKASLPRQRST